MPSANVTTALLCAILLCACTEQPLPVMKEPIPIAVPADGQSFAPRLTQLDTSRGILSWIESSDERNLLRFAEFRDDAWAPARTAVEDPRMFMNWADLPSVNETASGSLLAQWLSYTADQTYSYQILTSHSANAGVSWTPAKTPHGDDTETEHGFVSAFPADGGTGLLWLDGRNTPAAAMTLRSATISDDQAVFAETELDASVCDCCQTDVALTDSGPAAVYRNRSKDEVRDIYVSRQVDGAWLSGVAVANDGWVVSGCPVNGPAIDALGKRVVVAWYTGADRPTVKVAISNNAAKSFAAPLELARGKLAGHVGAAIIDRQSFVVSWLQAEKSGGYAVQIRGLTFDGQVTPVYTVGRTSVSRTVPQLLRIGDQLVFAWTDKVGDGDKVVSVRVPIVGFYD